MLFVRGHNETDEPSFTQPTMYNNIESRIRVPDLYMNELIEQGMEMKDSTEGLEEYKTFLLDESKRAETLESAATNLNQQWSGLIPAEKNVINHYDTGNKDFSGFPLITARLIERIRQLILLYM